MKIIEVFHIEHMFGEKRVLDDIHLSVDKGEILGLLGPSGAGKTTLIKILTGQLIQSGGRANLWGVDTRKLNGCDYKKIGIMMDHFGLYERLTCLDNLRMFSKIYGIPQNRVIEGLKDVGLAEAGKTRVKNLSKGMRSRLVLARALLARPEVLFLDEPASGLDPAVAEEIHQLIWQEKQRGTAIFLTTHNMAEAQKLCDRLALLFEGKLVEYGKPADICSKYNHQKQIRLLLHDGREMILPNTKESAKTIEHYMEQEQIETIHSTEPNLETVFMELTGRRLD